MRKSRQFCFIYFPILMLICFVVIYKIMTEPVFKKDIGQHCFIIKPGQSLSGIVAQFKTKKIIKYPIAFYFYARLTGTANHIQAGEYCSTPAMTSKQFLFMLNKGKVKQHKFTIVDGWNVRQVCAAISQAGNLQNDIDSCDAIGLAKALKLPYASAEGWLFPETYVYTLGQTASILLERAYMRMKDYLDVMWDNRDQFLPYDNQYQALIAASIIQQEASVPLEQQNVSSVIVNRLNSNMRLQMDATILYDLNKKIAPTSAELKVNSSYNTYTNKGLPPTPISMPGISALYSAMHPAFTDYFYYVANKQGEHIFSHTYDQHRTLINKIYKDK